MAWGWTDVKHAPMVSHVSVGRGQIGHDDEVRREALRCGISQEEYLKKLEAARKLAG